MNVSPHIRAQITTDGLVLLDTKGGAIYSSNTVGARIWEALVAGVPPATIAAQISQEYGVPDSTAAADIAEFKAALEVKGFLS
jgi:hypothetical protein